MPTITIQDGPSVTVPENTKLVLAIEDAGIDIMHRCGGNARCTTCRVEILEGTPPPMNDLERERLAREDALAPNIRLSCQIRCDSDLAVRVINRASLTGVPAGTRPLD
jgi:ferredoxin